MLRGEQPTDLRALVASIAMRRLGVGFVVFGLAGCLGNPGIVDGETEAGSTSGTSGDSESSTGSETTGGSSSCFVCGSSGPPDPETEGPGDAIVRVATWNILRVDAPGSPQFEALRDIVLRIDADVLCLQEVGEGEESWLQELAESGGYIDGLLAPASGPDGIGIANACMSRTPVDDAAYLWSNWISPDEDARDLTRPFVRLRLRVPGSDRYVSIVTGHLKAGGGEDDRFRRMVEHVRLGQAAASEFVEFPGNAVVVLGDLNEQLNPASEVFETLPPGLPSFYELGTDIALPLTYEPAKPLLDAGLERVEPSNDDTFIPGSRRLDYVYVGAAEIIAAEVYDACRDDPNEGVEKAGDPLDCGQSELASDHRPVVVDLRLR